MQLEVFMSSFLHGSAWCCTSILIILKVCERKSYWSLFPCETLIAILERERNRDRRRERQTGWCDTDRHRMRWSERHKYIHVNCILMWKGKIYERMLEVILIEYVRDDAHWKTAYKCERSYVTGIEKGRYLHEQCGKMIKRENVICRNIE